MDTQENAQRWDRAVRQGALQAFTYFRRRLRQGGEMRADERQGLIDLLDATEEHLVTMWQLVEMTEKVQHARMTRIAADKIRVGRRV